ncbi:E3 ubiquitin-protein ligase TRIM11 isoform X2 [Gambusia affinis]|nr:E3 ubiquitin-protein ligase TRIM11 isoform X2 [Gambusia affinis]XP_043989254.1 E3 ubiquitin-protein ligase TRIM11 isoform X2 [Gambusia affinis]XP_043989256.1 E3 ubiquitin-protein ligase TRIM11 isoform X2 [Gambusia affinis]
MDEEFTCSVCRDSFSQAHPLPCGHSFCPACIREAWSAQGEGKGRFTCPQCQEEHGEVLCDCCPLQAEDSRPPMAVKTCLRCEVSLCSDHLRPHLERPAFSSHLLVEPLGDLSQRRCPAHAEVFRYYCVDERVYVCGDCLLEGAHTLHKVKPLRQVEDDLKVILQTLLIKAEKKLKDGEKALKDHENIDSAMADSLKRDDGQVERLDTDLQAQVKKLVVALKEITRRERQQIVERVHQDCAKVRDDMSQTAHIQRYLNLLLAETDPFLLIWAFQSDDTKLLADLNCPLFLPEPISVDRKHILEDVEGKYREFITSTLRCLSELKRELCEWLVSFTHRLQRPATLLILTSPLSLDTNSAHPLLSISDDLRSVARVKSRLPCAAHPERFDHWPQVLTVQTFSSGTHYWELEAEGFWDVAVCYRSIGRKGKEGNAFGNNKVSWSLTQQHDKKLSAWHNRRKTRLTYQMVGNRVAVAVDYSSGTVTFSEVGPSNTLIHLHTFSTSFTQPVCLGFGLYKAELKSRISVVKV